MSKESEKQKNKKEKKENKNEKKKILGIKKLYFLSDEMAQVLIAFLGRESVCWLVICWNQWNTSPWGCGQTPTYLLSIDSPVLEWSTSGQFSSKKAHVLSSLDNVLLVFLILLFIPNSLGLNVKQLERGMYALLRETNYW